MFLDLLDLRSRFGRAASGNFPSGADALQKGGVPAAPSGTATLLRLSPNYQFCLRSLLGGDELQAPPAFMA